MSTTVSDILIQSLKKAGVLGVGQLANAEDMNDAFQDLNDMLAQWSVQRWLVWHLIESSVTSTGAQFYTIGVGQNFNTPRPDRIESAFLRQLVTTQPNQVDYPLEILQSREDYNRIALKTLGTFPSYIFYDSAYPVGKVYPWPIPQQSIYSVHIAVKEQLLAVTSMGQIINFPPAYLPMIKWNLAVRLCASYKIPASPELVALAETSLNLIRNSNAQIPRLMMPADLCRSGRYDIFSNQIR